MKKVFLLSVLFSLTSLVWAAGVVDLAPFGERFPKDSIKSKARADEVIKAYEEENRALEAWKKEQDKLCYRKLLVNNCLSDNANLVREKKREAKAVWVVARDFIRRQDAQKAKSERLAKEKKREEEVKRIEAQKPSAKGMGLVGPEPDADIDTSGMMTTESVPRPDINPRNVPDPDRDHRVSQRVISDEEQAENEAAYAQKQEKREARIREAQQSEPPQPSTTEAEREQSRAERRKMIEQRKRDNIRKRQQKAAEYERQVKLRENQSNSLLTMP